MSSFPAEGNIVKKCHSSSLELVGCILAGVLSLSVVLSLMQMEEMEEEKTTTSVSSQLSSQPLL